MEGPPAQEGGGNGGAPFSTWVSVTVGEALTSCAGGLVCTLLHRFGFGIGIHRLPQILQDLDRRLPFGLFRALVIAERTDRNLDGLVTVHFTETLNFAPGGVDNRLSYDAGAIDALMSAVFGFCT